jgi:CRISPR-associated Csx11 family protein
MSKNLDVLTEHRNFILLAEIGALIHDLGKLSTEFISHCSAECVKDRKSSPWCQEDPHWKFLQPKYQNFVSKQLVDILNDRSAQKFLKIEFIKELEQAPVNLGEFIATHHPRGRKRRKPNIGLINLLIECDHIDSGIDKGTVPKATTKQYLADTRISTAFGDERHPIPISSDELRAVRYDFAKVLENTLSQIIQNKAKSKQVRQQIFDAARDTFCQALGETRRTANDVTLWDHSYSVASLYKAGLAQAILEERWPCSQPGDLAELKWRILRIACDGLDFLEQTHRITDILGRQWALKSALNALQRLLEVKYPLGNEIYRDENGSAFVVPNISDLLERADNNGKSLRKLIQELFAVSDLRGEVRLSLSPKFFSNPSRSAILLGKLLVEPVPPLSADPNKVKQWWGDLGEICTVCGLRPQGYDAPAVDNQEKAKDRNLCYICLERRGRRSKEWATKSLNSTIWIDETADINARVALVVGRFGLDDWLNGAFTDTIFTRALTFHHLSYTQLIKGLKEALKGSSTAILDKVGGVTWGHFKRENLKSSSTVSETESAVEKFYQVIVEERDTRRLSKNVSTLDERASLLGLFLFRKHPSFARLRRVWQTTRRFWINVGKGFDAQPSLIAEATGQTGRRLKITATNVKKFNLGDYHAYELVLEDMRLSIVWAPHLNGFISADNLCYVVKQLGRPEAEWGNAEAAVSFVKDRLSGNIKIQQPSGYGMKHKELGVLRDVKAEILKDDQDKPQSYSPIIPILTEPRIFMALVPARKALEVLIKIKERYEAEMGKVRNRLPLQVGIIYFHRRIPLRAALEAGRQILKVPVSDYEWRVAEQPQKRREAEVPDYLKIRRQHFKTWYEVRLERKGKQVVWSIPLKMGDGTTDDIWYPYVFVKTLARRHPSDEPKFMFRAPCPWNGNQMTELLHVEELHKEDEVYFTPAIFDFEWLDTAGRRFEIIYGNNGKRPSRLRRPYLLDEVVILPEAWERIGMLSSSQIYALRDLIRAKREEWYSSLEDETFMKFCRDAILTTEWPKGEHPREKADTEKLVNWAATGLLEDVVELYMNIMKEKPRGKQI